MKIITSIAFSCTVLFYTGFSWAHEDKEAPEIAPMFKIMSSTSFDRVARTHSQIVDQSEAIVAGHIVSVTEGRILHHSNGRSSPLRMALFKFQVNSSVRGDVGEYVYFEYIKGGMSVDRMHANRYQGEMVMFLRESGWGNPATYVTEWPDGSLAREVDTLYTLVDERALLVETEPGGEAFSPMGHEGDPLFPDGLTLEDILTDQVPVIRASGGELVTD